jgi:hypothetical protein
MPKSVHERVSKQIERKRNIKYNPGKGVDFNPANFAGEVEPNTQKLSEGMRQLQGYKKPSYLIVPKDIVPEAIDRTKGTTVGVMDETGKIRKRSTRKKK